ncbi:MAG: hypothetical protein OXB88_07890 [Bacteriovoracales bacterium]|nr:hypothetical protein [Bacteriovoracales bacterium]
MVVFNIGFWLSAPGLLIKFWNRSKLVSSSGYVKKNGLFIVFEGADGTGKSSISTFAKKNFAKVGLDVVNASFPGKDDNTLGGLVYDIHHNQKKYFSSRIISNDSIQALHIAAHIDCIQNVIIPSLKDGRCILLDRYWWSTYVYGKAGGMNSGILDRLCSIDKLMFSKILPDKIFLLTRDSSLKKETPVDHWRKLNNEYLKLAKNEQKISDNISIIFNKDYKKTLETIKNLLHKLLNH